MSSINFITAAVAAAFLCGVAGNCVPDQDNGVCTDVQVLQLTNMARVAVGEEVRPEDLRADGWALLAKSVRGEAGTVDLSSSAADIMAGGSKVRIAWSTASDPGDVDQMLTYEKIVEFTIPGQVTSSPRTTAGKVCSDPDFFTLVDVTCVRGECKMPAQMYTGTGFNRVCYDKAYGLVKETSTQPQCDWFMDTQAFSALYIGNAGCHGVKDTSGETVKNDAMRAIAIWSKAPTASPTPSPTVEPTSAPTAVTVTAFGDPHLKNILNQAFEVRMPGVHTLLNVPRGVADADALLCLRASMVRMGGGCSPLFIRSLDVGGHWLGGVPPLKFSAGAAPPGEVDGAGLQVGNSSTLTIDDFLARVPAGMIRLAMPDKPIAMPSVINKHATMMTAALKVGPDVRVKVSWTHERTSSAAIAHALWISVTGLSTLRESVGGLLGIDDHSQASSPDQRCVGNRSSKYVMQE